MVRTPREGSIHVVIEIPRGSRNKYEIDHATGVVFLDPPYDDVVLDRALKVLDRTIEGATVVAEHSRRQEMPPLVRLKVDRQRRYGDTMVTVFRS